MTRRASYPLAVLVAAGVFGALPGAAFAADPVPLATAELFCNSAHFGTVLQFPAASGSASDVMFSASSMGANGFLASPPLTFGNVADGEKIWGEYDGSVTAGRSPGRAQISCNRPGGTIDVALYAVPTAPTTFSGATHSYSFYFPFRVPVKADYSADVSVSQGRIRVNGTIVGSSQTVSLGTDRAGIRTVHVKTVVGPLAKFSIAIHARGRPVAKAQAATLAPLALGENLDPPNRWAEGS